MAAPRVEAVLRDSAKSEAAADSYVHGPGPKAPIIDTLTALTTRLRLAVRAMKASRLHGHYGAAQVRAARAAADALAAFLANKGE